MAIERTLAIVKPDGVMMGLTEKILDRYCSTGLGIIRGSYRRFTKKEAALFYEAHKEKFFFCGLVLSMTNEPTYCILLEGEGAIQKIRDLNGATKWEDAAEGTIRRDFRSAGGPFNVVHGSDSPEAVLREVAIVFPNEKMG